MNALGKYLSEPTGKLRGSLYCAGGTSWSCPNCDRNGWSSLGIPTKKGVVRVPIVIFDSSCSMYFLTSILLD